MNAVTLAVGALLLSTSSVASVPVHDAVAPHEADSQLFPALVRRQELNATSTAAAVASSASSILTSVSSAIANATSALPSATSSAVANSTSAAVPAPSSTSTANSTTPAVNGTSECIVDQTVAPGNLSLCGNNTLFNIWRPKARVTGPAGWINDPMSMVQLPDGTLHVGKHPEGFERARR